MTNVMTSFLNQFSIQLSKTVITSLTMSVRLKQFKNVNKQLKKLKRNRDENKRKNLKIKIMFKDIYELLIKNSD